MIGCRIIITWRHHIIYLQKQGIICSLVRSSFQLYDTVVDVDHDDDDDDDAHKLVASINNDANLIRIYIYTRTFKNVQFCFFSFSL